MKNLEGSVLIAGVGVPVPQKVRVGVDAPQVKGRVRKCVAVVAAQVKAQKVLIAVALGREARRMRVSGVGRIGLEDLLTLNEARS